MSAERDLQHKAVKSLRDSGFVVRVFSQHRRVMRQVANFPDAIAFKDSRTFLLEFKAPGDKLRPGQEEFRADVLPECGEHLQHHVIDDLLQVRLLISEYG